MSRDPMEEWDIQGAYGFLYNAAVSDSDYLGLLSNADIDLVRKLADKIKQLKDAEEKAKEWKEQYGLFLRALEGDQRARYALIRNTTKATLTELAGHLAAYTGLPKKAVKKAVSTVVESGFYIYDQGMLIVEKGDCHARASWLSGQMSTIGWDPPAENDKPHGLKYTGSLDLKIPPKDTVAVMVMRCGSTWIQCYNKYGTPTWVSFTTALKF